MPRGPLAAARAKADRLRKLREPVVRRVVAAYESAADALASHITTNLTARRVSAAVEEYRHDLEQLATLTTTETAALVREATDVARLDAPELVEAVTGEKSPALRYLEGVAFDNTGFTRMLRNRAGEHADEAAQILMDAVDNGWRPGRTAAELATKTGMPAQIAATIAVTEQNRAHRGGLRMAWQEVDDINRWQWVARCNENTCAHCWANHGRIFRLNQQMGSHPNCCCTMIPLRRGEARVGDLGTDLFDAADPAVQARVLAPSKLLAYRDGAISLDDLTSRRRSRPWGYVGAERSLSGVLGPEAAAPYIRAAIAAGRRR